MNQIAKKGDMALVLPCNFARTTKGGIPWSGVVVRVLSDPSWQTDSRDWSEKFFNSCEHNGVTRWVQTRRLIPIRNPDTDVSRTTDREAMA